MVQHALAGWFSPKLISTRFVEPQVKLAVERLSLPPHRSKYIFIRRRYRSKGNSPSVRASLRPRMSGELEVDTMSTLRGGRVLPRWMHLRSGSLGIILWNRDYVHHHRSDGRHGLLTDDGVVSNSVDPIKRGAKRCAHFYRSPSDFEATCACGRWSTTCSAPHNYSRRLAFIFTRYKRDRKGVGRRLPG